MKKRTGQAWICFILGSFVLLLELIVFPLTKFSILASFFAGLNVMYWYADGFIQELKNKKEHPKKQ